MDDMLAVLRALGEESAADAVAPHWAASGAAYDPARLPFLDPACWKAHRAYADLDEALDADLAAVSDGIRADPALSRLAGHYAWRVWEEPDRAFLTPPALRQPLGDRAGLFYVLIALDWVPRLRAWHQSLRWLGGNMFLLPDDLPSFGTGTYRREAAP